MFNIYIYLILIVDVLLQGNSVIRPVAFKPGSMRFTDNGERYGSTPILARSSHRHLYGSKYIYTIHIMRFSRVHIAVFMHMIYNNNKR